MKKIILLPLVSLFVANAANAATGGVYQDFSREVAGNQYANNYNNVYAQRPAYVYRNAVRPDYSYQVQSQNSVPCGRTYGEPVSVKTGTEVINHYQTYRPVTQYVPSGTYETRRVIQVAQPCNTCGY